MGYQSNNTIVNLGSIFLFIFFRILILWVIFFMLIFQKVMGERAKKVLVYLYKTNIFNGILLLLYESYFELCMSCYLGIVYPSSTSLNGEIIGHVTAWILLVIGVILVPLLTFSFIFKTEKYLKKQSSIRKFGALYANTRLTNSFERMYPFNFCLRRLAAVAVIFSMNNHGAIQIIFSVYCNILSIIYITRVKPMPHRAANRIEIFNEVMILVISLNLFTFTDFVPDSKHRFNMGYMMLAQNYLMISVNILLTIFNTTIHYKLHLRLKILICRKLLKRKITNEERELENASTQAVIDSQVELKTVKKTKSSKIKKKIRKPNETKKKEEEKTNHQSNVSFTNPTSDPHT